MSEMAEPLVRLAEAKQAMREFLAPYDNVGDEFLRQMVDTDRGTVRYMGHSLTSHLARAILRAREILGPPNEGSK